MRKSGSLQYDLTGLKRVLVIKPSSLGDVIHTLPAVHFLKNAAPWLTIDWLVNKEWAPVLSDNPDLETIIEFPRSAFRGTSGISTLAKWIRKTRPANYDLALDFQGLTRSGLLAKHFNCRAIHCLQDAELPARLLATRVIPSKRNIHAVDRYLRLITDLGIDWTSSSLEFPLPRGTPPDPQHPIPKSYILLHPFSRGKGKSMTAHSVEKLCQLLSPIPVVIAGVCKPEPDLSLPEHSINLLNQTSILNLIWLIRHASFVISVDSGPMHIAAALTSNLLGIHSWSNPSLVGPRNPKAAVWKNGEIRMVNQIDDPFATSKGSSLDHLDEQQIAGFVKEKLASNHSGSGE